MADEESRWRAYVEACDVEVSQEAIENERAYLELQMRHNMLYDRLAGGGLHAFPELELQAQAEQLQEAAVFEAKEPLVIRRIVSKQGFDVSSEELEAEALAMAQRQGTTVEELRRFFGDDLAMLRRDVLERKAREWACGQMGDGQMR